MGIRADMRQRASLLNFNSRSAVIRSRSLLVSFTRAHESHVSSATTKHRTNVRDCGHLAVSRAISYSRFGGFGTRRAKPTKPNSSKVSTFARRNYIRSRASAQEDRPGDYTSQYFSVHDLRALLKCRSRVSGNPFLDADAHPMARPRPDLCHGPTF